MLSNKRTKRIYKLFYKLSKHCTKLECYSKAVLKQRYVVSCAIISAQVDYSNLVIPHPAFAKRITQIITSHLQILNRSFKNNNNTRSGNM